jgi:AraC family transcriptional regulator
MNTLDSGIFFIEEKKFEECDWHVTRLSLNFSFDASQSYFIGNREYRISPEKYLLINEGQSFKTFAASPVENRMVTIAFRVGLAEEIYNTLNNSNEYLLDHTTPDKTPLNFFERTYPLDDFFQNRILSLIQTSPASVDKHYLNEQLESILAHLLLLQTGVQKDALSINKVRTATRIEIYRRLHWALEYIHNHFHEDINVEQLAAQSCLSPFHFKRLFREFFHEPPYQYIKKLRIQRATELLMKGQPVNEVCKAVGWEDPSSFIRLFKQVMKVTPRRFGIEVRPKAGSRD